MQTGRGAGSLLGLLMAIACAGGVGSAANTGLLTGPIPPTPPRIAGPAITGVAEPGATVVVTILLNGREIAERAIVATTTLGLGCLTKPGCTTPTAVGRVAANSRFAVGVPRAVTARDDLAVTVIAARGAQSRVSTSLVLPPSARAGADVGTVPLARTTAKVWPHGRMLQFAAPPVPAAHGPAQVALSRIEPDSDQLIAKPPSLDVSSGFDPRLVEDGQVLLVGTELGAVGPYHAVFTATIVYAGTQVPASRDAACSIEGSRGQDIAQHPCGLTNGMLDTNWQPQDDPACADGPCPGPSQRDVRDVTITLSRAILTDYIVVRGCGFTCSVGLSSDGRSFGFWRAAPSDADPESTFVITLPPTRIVAVRVQTATGGFFAALRQVSVFAI